MNAHLSMFLSLGVCSRAPAIMGKMSAQCAICPTTMHIMHGKILKEGIQDVIRKAITHRAKGINFLKLGVY